MKLRRKLEEKGTMVTGPNRTLISTCNCAMVVFKVDTSNIHWSSSSTANECALICVARILGAHLSIHKNDGEGRDVFDNVASAFQYLYIGSGHYHISVVARILREQYKLRLHEVS